MPLKSPDGRDLRVSFAVDPVMDLKAFAIAGHHIESRIVDLLTGAEIAPIQRRGLAPSDFNRIDLSALERGLSRIAGVETFDRPRLIIQLSFSSLGAIRGREILLNRARELQHILRQAAICELVDVPPGVPLSRLTEVVSQIRGVFRSLWLQVEPSRQSIETACAAKPSGLTVRAADLGSDPAVMVRGMKGFMERINRSSFLLTVTSLPTRELMLEAVGAGFTHATLRAAKPAVVATAAPAPAA